LEKVRTSIAEEKKISEKQRIEELIKSKGLEAGISELERTHKGDKDNAADYWGSVRGKLHLLMARDRIDHLDSRGAEKQLLLAEKYGVDPQKWQSVRSELIALRRESVLLGADKLAARRMKKKPASKKYSSFLAVVQKAKKNGEKLPPIHLLQLVDRYAKLNQLDPLLVWAMIDTESSWRVDVVAHDGGQGLMQLMPPTAKELDVSNPLNAEQNIRGGTSYFRFLLGMFKDTDTALAAYNVGPGRVERTGVPPAGKRYIKKVRTRFASLKKRFGVS
jgi:soluble lytic murein transglycosylase-like protein